MTIEVQPYIDKLDELNAYMNLWVECYADKYFMLHRTWEIYTDTGNLLYSTPKEKKFIYPFGWI